jgi:hypothetical protein
MAESQVGAVAVVWGLPGTPAFTVAGTGIAWIANEMPLEYSADMEETRNSDGEVVNVCFYNQQETISLTVFPASTTKALARTASVLPEPGMRVGIIGTVDSQVQATTPGREFVVLSATKTPSITGKTVFNLNLKRWDGISSYSPLS